MTRKSKGRQRLEIVRMSNERYLQATFAKRRFGIFKKASELCTLCGVEMAIVVFSPGRKVFSFGHPCVESVLNRFITQIPQQTLGTLQFIEAHRNVSICELNMQLTQVLNELEIEKKRGEDLTQMKRSSQSHRWWAAPIDELNPSQLANLKICLEDLKQQVTQQANEVMTQSTAPLQCFPGNSSTGEILQFDPTNIDSNLSNKNTMLPPSLPPLIQSFDNPQDFSRSSSTTGNPDFDPNNFGINPPNMNAMPSPSMIHSLAHPQYFSGGSSTEVLLQFEPTNIRSNPSNKNMMPPPPPPMIQSFAHPQDFPRSSSTRRISQFDPNNIGFNLPNMNLVPSPPMIQSSAAQYYPGSSSTGGSSSAGGILQFDPTNTGSNLFNNNMMSPPPLNMIESFAHRQDFSRSSSTEDILQFNPNNIGFNPTNMNVMHSPPMIQSSTPQYFSGSSNTGGIIPLEVNKTNFNNQPHNSNMMPPPHLQPLHFPSPPHYPHPGLNSGVNQRFY